MTINTIQTPVLTYNTQNIDLKESAKTQMTIARTRWIKSINEVINLIAIASCNHKDERSRDFNKLEENIKLDLKRIEDSPTCPDSLIRKKPRKFKLGYMPCDTYLSTEYEQLTQVHKLYRDPKLTKEEIAIKDEDSLFYNRPDLKKHRLELLRIASDVDKARSENPDDFMRSFRGMSVPIFHNEFNVVFKRTKSPSIATYSYMLRKYIKDLKLDKIVVPSRETWREKRVRDPGDNKIKSSPIYIENMENNICSYISSHYIYKNIPNRLEEVIEQYVALSCYLEVGDTCMGNRQMKEQSDFYLNDDNYKDCFYPKCRCNFNNIVLQEIEDEEKGNYYRFVLVDLDVIKEPSKTTVANLLSMFPDHKELIYNTVLKHNPDLLKGTPAKRRIDQIPLFKFMYEEEQLKGNYKKEERFKEKYGEHLQKLEEEKLAAEGKLDGYKSLKTFRPLSDSVM